MGAFEKIVMVTQKTWLDNLVEKFNTKEQAKFYIEHAGGSFKEYLDAHTIYYNAIQTIKNSITNRYKFQIVEKSYLPNFHFNDTDLVLVVGRDGLVVNTAKYLDQQKILGINPDHTRNAGILLPFTLDDVVTQLQNIENNDESISLITLSQAQINSYSKIFGVNDIFIGHKSHQSARYLIKFRGVEEHHSSSGIIISTGLGSTGWLKSILTGAIGIVQNFRSELDLFPLTEKEYKLPWDADALFFSVREPWQSKVTGSNLVFGKINKGEKLIIESEMPDSGVIFSDGTEQDNLEFNSGCTASISIADKKIKLVIPN